MFKKFPLDEINFTNLYKTHYLLIYLLYLTILLVTNRFQQKIKYIYIHALNKKTINVKI